MMRIYYISFNKNSPSFRYRGRILFNELSQRFGIRVSFHSPSFHTLFFLLWLWVLEMMAPRRDRVFVFQKISKVNVITWICQALAHASKHTIYDLDDALYVIRSDSIINFFAAKCRCITVGSSHLQQHFIQLGARPKIITTPVPPPIHRKGNRNPEFTIGWIGTLFSHQENLQRVLFPALQRLNIPTRVVIIGARNNNDRIWLMNILSEVSNLTLEIPLVPNWDDWGHINKLLVDCDVGVSPLIDDEMGKARSAFKVKQYLACGLPVIASPVGENTAYVYHGKNGFLCATTDEWLYAFEKFRNLSDSEYNAMSKFAFCTYITSDFSVDAVVNRLGLVLGSIEG